MARLVYWLMDHLGPAETLKYLTAVSYLFLPSRRRTHTQTKIAQVDVPMPFMGPTVDWKLARTEFAKLIDEFVQKDDVPEDFPASVEFEAILSDTTEAMQEKLEKAKRYAKRLRADLASAPQGHVFVNGKHFNLDDVSRFCMLLDDERLNCCGQDFLRGMQLEAGQQLQHL